MSQETLINLFGWLLVALAILVTALVTKDIIKMIGIVADPERQAKQHRIEKIHSKYLEQRRNDLVDSGIDIDAFEREFSAA